MLQIGSDLILIVGVRNFILAKMCRHYLALSQRPALDKTKMIKRRERNPIVIILIMGWLIKLKQQIKLDE